MKSTWVSVLAAASLVLGTGVTAAFSAPPADKGGPAQRGKGHQHHHMNGHNLLGDNLKHDGKHEVAKLGGKSVAASVKGGKVVNMTVSDSPMKRVRSRMKMAAADPMIVKAAYGAVLQKAQYDSYYYGYCADDGYDYTCYWYPASDVDYADYTWDEYDPTY